MKCVSSISFYILINDSSTISFFTQMGLKQGDPLSLYLFIIYAEVFSELRAQRNNLILSIKIVKWAP